MNKLKSAACILLLLLCIYPLQAGSLLVKCNQAGAAVRMGDQTFGQTDNKGMAYLGTMASGTYMITVSKPGFEVFTQNTVVGDKLTSIVLADLVKADKTPPEIKLLAPQQSRGMFISSREELLHVAGLARDDNDVSQVKVNGITATLSAPSGEALALLPGNTIQFETDLRLAEGLNQLKIEAIDSRGNRGLLEQRLQIDSKNLMTGLDMKCYALLIGINEYDQWAHLINPVYDIQTLDKELKENYGFQTQLLAEAGRSQINSAIRNFYNQKFGDNDQLLIVMCGHGHFDDLSKTGYFVGKDGRKAVDDPNFDTYISYPNLINLITNIPCKHILLVLDACFAGTINQQVAMGPGPRRGDEGSSNDLPPREKILTKLQFTSRLAVTSGGKEYVPDGRPGQHSPFMRKFLEGLRNYGGKEGMLSIDQLYSNYLDSVSPHPFSFDMPGDDPGGSFIFIAR